MSFPKYTEYKETLVGWLESVPQNWDLFKGKRIFSQRKERASASDDQLAASQAYGIIPQKRMMEITGNKVMLALGGTESFRHVAQDDFVISLRSFEGGIEHSPYDGCVSPAYTVLTSNRKIHPWFYRYLLKSRPYVAALQASTDSLRDGKSITFEQFGDIALPYPSVDEQRTIARFLDHETAKVDSLIREQERLIELLQEKRQAVISHAVTKGLDPDVLMKDSGVEWLGEVPAHWKRCSLKFLVTPDDGIQMGPFGGMLKELEEQPTGFKVYGQENTISGDFSRGSRWITHDRFNRLESYHLGKGDIVLTRKGSLGNARLIGELPQPGIIDSDTIRVRVDSQKLLPRFLETLLHQSTYISEQIRVTKRGAILAGLNSETIAGLSVVTPPVEEQEELIIYIRENTRAFDDAVGYSSTTIQILKERRSALISAAVTGKIDVRDWQPPADESAFDEGVRQVGVEATA